MNTYTTEFFSRCPANGARIKYVLVIETLEAVRVEEILEAVQGETDGFHERIADRLFDRFGGRQILTADHHGVTIQTTRTQ